VTIIFVLQEYRIVHHTSNTPKQKLSQASTHMLTTPHYLFSEEKT